MRRCWRRRLLSRSLRLAAGPLISPTSLRALGRRRLHPPSAGSLHSHSLGGLRKWRAVAVHLDFFSLSHDGGNSRGSEGDLIKSVRAAATEENEKI
jgi:hypothetical protein